MFVICLHSLISPFRIRPLFSRAHSDTGIYEAVAYIHNDTCRKADRGIEAGEHHKHIVISAVYSVDKESTNTGNGKYLLNNK